MSEWSVVPVGLDTMTETDIDALCTDDAFMAATSIADVIVEMTEIKYKVNRFNNKVSCKI